MVEEKGKKEYRKQKGQCGEEYEKDRKVIEFYNIPTSHIGIKQSILWHDLSRELQALIAYGREHPDYKMRLAVYAWQIYTLFRYVYLGKEGNYQKLSAERYARALFLDAAENPDELSGRYFTNETRETGFRIYKAICDAICPMLACNGGDRFWPDHVACLVDYIIKEEGNVPAPEMNGGVPYPCNYPRPYDNGRPHFLPEEIAK